MTIASAITPEEAKAIAEVAYIYRYFLISVDMFILQAGGRYIKCSFEVGDHRLSMCEYLRQCLEFDNVIAIVFVGTNIPHVAYSRVYGSDVFRHVAEQYLSGAYLLDPISEAKGAPQRGPRH